MSQKDAETTAICKRSQFPGRMRESQPSPLQNRVSNIRETIILYLRAFGILGRSPAQSEVDYMSRWLKEYELPLDLITEACNRTIERIHQPKFSYTEKILSDWRTNGIKTLKQLKSTEEQQKAKRPTPVSQSPSASTNNRFNNFHQRQYDFEQLEKQLLNAD